ncbi:MAG: tetratricopeptide repeat protein [Hydrogenophaga sp.]|uniref:tetratricopeptide repeat protein n=1 Tax=Hydrogenophaga sp. TaxID=1904254 RepID=UPI002ABB8E5D|nr:tetratricopeptide repeat protein [Hydrogenophaga sp.]MDZ4283880.1 tetratricopeptide repeat protein [Hydrogenophaga sp.]
MSRTPRILRQPHPNFRNATRHGGGPQSRVVIDPGRSALAGKYFLSDVPGATVPASRLSTVLENIELDKRLSATAFEYLRQQGYLALMSLVAGESNYEQFSNLARVEQRRRESVAANIRQKEQAERQRAIAESAAREAARTAEYERQRRIQESDPKYVAKVKNQRLRARYGVDQFIEKESFNRLMGILHRIDGGARFSDEDVLWLTTEGSDYYSDELRFAFHSREAAFFASEFARTRDSWNVVNASGHFRKCDRAGAAHALLEGVSLDGLKSPKLKSAVRTTHGGVMRDLGRFDEAFRYGTEAHALTDGDFRPCTLLGAVNVELGNYETARDWYAKAAARGASERSIDDELRGIYMRADKSKRDEIRAFLIREDPVRYKWAHNLW